MQIAPRGRPGVPGTASGQQDVSVTITGRGNGLTGGISKSVGPLYSSAQKVKNISGTTRQTFYGNRGGGMMGSSVLAGNNMMIQNLSAIGSDPFSQLTPGAGVSSNSIQSFPPVVLLKKDPASQTMYKINGGNNLQSFPNGLSYQTQNNAQGLSTNNVQKRAANINLVAPAAYP